MRKMMNKKGFSLVELMIVVVIMGILIAVAIPLYGAITTNANNKTCATNIETIKTTAANYYASYDQKPLTSTDELAAFMDDGKVPVCPLGGTYGIAINTKGGADVVCLNEEGGSGADNKHKPDGNLAAFSAGATELIAAVKGTN